MSEQLKQLGWFPEWAARAFSERSALERIDTSIWRDPEDKVGLVPVYLRNEAEPTPASEMDRRSGVAGGENVSKKECVGDSPPAASVDSREALTVDDMERARQWYANMVDVNPAYAEAADHALAVRLYQALGMRVPNSNAEVAQGSVAKLAAAVGQEAPAGWQPIETAPKDETTVMVASSDFDIVGVAYWVVRPRAGGRWECSGALRWEPTHWMPLPASPQQPGDKP